MSSLRTSNFIARRAAAAIRPASSRSQAAARPRGLLAQLLAIENATHRWLIVESIEVLRVSIGVVFLAFGVLKFFPGVSPAQDLVEATTDVLTLGLIPGPVALVLVATLESIIGLCLITRRAMRAAIYLLAFQLIGILSPLVLLPARLFHGPHGAPTLEGQYVLKDIILVGAGLVLSARCLPGVRCVHVLPDKAPRETRADG
jgi:putative oxidoreductase